MYVIKRGPARKYSRAEVVEERESASVCGSKNNYEDSACEFRSICRGVLLSRVVV